MITLLVFILIVLVLILVGLCCVMLCIKVQTDDIIAAIARERVPVPADLVKDHPLRPHARDGLTLEDLLQARNRFESGKPGPLPPLSE